MTTSTPPWVGSDAATTAVLAAGVSEIFLTPPDAERFFGYHDKCPWDASGSRLLAHATTATGGLPELHDRAVLELWALEDGLPRALGETAAFNWQQGAMLQWLGPDYSSRVLWNDRREGRLVAVIHDVATGEERAIPQPVYAVAPNGRTALGVDFERHFWCRRGYAYASLGDPTRAAWVPEGDGLFDIDLEAGTSRLALTTQEVMDRDSAPTMLQGPNYLEHVVFSPAGKRVAFLHRWHVEGGGIFSRLYTARQDLSDLRLAREGAALTHFTWMDERTILVYGNRSGGADMVRKSGLLTHLRPLLLPLYRKVFTAGSAPRRLLLGLEFFAVDVDDGTTRRFTGGDGPITEDGHPACHPERPWLIACDTYEDGGERRHLFLFDLEKGVRVPVGHFHSPPEADASPWRADLHPRWDQKGERICIDSLHSGTRRIHLLDVSRLL